MSLEIEDSFIGTCSLMVEYYSTLKKSIIKLGAHKSRKKLLWFINKLKKTTPLIYQSEGLNKKDKNEAEKLLIHIHDNVVNDLNKWMKKDEAKNILNFINKQITRHENIIKSLKNQLNGKKNVKISNRKKCYKYTVINNEDSSDEDSSYVPDENTDDEMSTSEDDSEEYSGSEEESESEEEEDDESVSESGSEAESDSESEIEKQKSKKKTKIKNKESDKEDIKKIKDYFKKSSALPFNNVKSQILAFEKLEKKDRKKIISHITNNDNTVSCPLIYKIMLSNLPDDIKSDMIHKLESQFKNEDDNPKYNEYVTAALKIPYNVTVQSKVNSKSKTNDIKSFLEHTSKCMDDAVYGHDKAKQQILQFVAQNISNPNPKGLVLGVQGPYGNGKTTLIEKGFAKALGRPFCTIPLGGVQDGSFLEGHSFTYEGSRWGMIVNVLMNSKCMNPIIYMDELDKVSKTAKGDEINNLLIHLIDPSQNHHFRDKYFADLNIDLSQAIFIFSYNDRDAINPILMDRITHIKTRGFRMPEKVIISKNYLLKSILEDVGIAKSNIKFSDSVLEWIIKNYTNEGGVRNLKQICYEIIREINLRHLTKKGVKYPYNVTQKVLKSDILSNRLCYKHDKIHEKPMIGKVNGLYATVNETGGLVQIETVWVPNESNLKLELTGNQGDVMKESMHVAKTLAWKLLPDSIKTNLKDTWKNKGNQSIHIHCPEGAVPKDGPSAGAAITTALYSLMSGKKIRNDIGLTGEIDLSGKILEIGGLESKIFGAKAAGCKKVLCPTDNLDSLQKIITDHPDIFTKDFQVKTVSNINDVLKILLV